MVKLPEEFNIAYLGYLEIKDKRVSVYSYDLIIEELVKNGNTLDEAVDHFYFNFDGLKCEGFPMFLFKEG